MFKRILKSRIGKLCIGLYVLYIIGLMISSWYLGIQLGTDLHNMSEAERQQYIGNFIVPCME